MSESERPERRTNHSGDEARRVIAELLEGKGYIVSRRQSIGTGIYGTELRADVVVESCHRWPHGLIVDVCAQSARGSADHKFPYFVENIRRCHPMPTVIVLVGDGFSPGSVDWLTEQVDSDRLVGVFTLDDFEYWVSRPPTA